MNRFHPFLIGFLLVSSTLCAQHIDKSFQTKSYMERMAFFAKNSLQKHQIVFLGNSITQAGKWDTYFPNKNPANRGISGDNTEGMLARLDEIIDAYPTNLFIMAGINDISLGRPNCEIIANYRQIIERIQQHSPQTGIFIQSVLPINNDFNQYARLIGKENQVKLLNHDLRKLSHDKNCTFINLYPFFADENNKLKERYTADGLHLTHDAYLFWRNLIHRFLK